MRVLEILSGVVAFLGVGMFCFVFLFPLDTPLFFSQDTRASLFFFFLVFRYTNSLL